MKPGKSTIETLTNHILNFETSRKADKTRLLTWDLVKHLRVLSIGASGGGQLSWGLSDAAHTIASMMVTHRELRRAAQRLAKMALQQNKDLEAAHVEHDALITRVMKLEAEIDRTSKDEWDDKELRPEEEKAMHEAFPTRSNRHDLYQESMRMVGAKRSKGALVELVNWLLHRAQHSEPTEDDYERAKGFLWRVTGQQPTTLHVGELGRMIARSRTA